MCSVLLLAEPLLCDGYIATCFPSFWDHDYCIWVLTLAAGGVLPYLPLLQVIETPV